MSPPSNIRRLRPLSLRESQLKLNGPRDQPPREVLLAAGRTVHLTISPAAVEVIERELDLKVHLDRFDLVDLLGEAGRRG